MTSPFGTAGWNADGTWTAHTLPADPVHHPLPASFELPDFLKRSKTSEVPQWNQLAPDGSDYFQVLFGGHDPLFLRLTLQEVSKSAPAAETLNQIRYTSTLERLRESPDRYRLIDADFNVEGAAKAILFEVLTAASDVSVQREALEMALASLPPAERENEIRKVLGETSAKTKWQLVAIADGKTLRVIVEYTHQEAAAKKKITDRFFQTLAIR